MPNLPVKRNPTLTIIDLLVRGECVSAQEIADKTGLAKLEIMRVMGDPVFVQHYGKLTKEAARTEFDSVKYKTLMEIIQNAESNKEKIEAIKTMDEFFKVGEGTKRDGQSGTLEGVIKDMATEDELVIGIQKRKFKGLQ